ncbi:MAG: ATP-dependent helicase HrpB [Paracoccaceae bacterium]
MKDTLPIDAVLPELVAALRSKGRAVLQAPPGAGKTTRVPLAMLSANLCAGRIVMLEPRRLAARAAAERMAQTLEEPVGHTVGYRVRGDTKTSDATRIEVVTEGILTRMIQSQPDLPGVGAVIFDEFHERSLNSDLGLALCLDVAGALRDDLALVVMSATLDADPVAALMKAPVITSEGRAYRVETRWLERPLANHARFGAAMCDLVEQAVSESSGGVLVFLPGEGEIRRVAAGLNGRLPSDCAIRPLFGAMDFNAQRAAIAPAKNERKVVLATSIAETSLTIEGIRVVVDGGQSRRARFDSGSGMSRLVTERASRAETTQRKGRAGRIADGVCYRLWAKSEEGGMPPLAPAEMDMADLAGLALELANWGVGPDDIPLLTPPNAGAYAEAQRLLQMLNALDGKHRITGHGRAMARLPLHPRLAHMLLMAGREAARLAATISERDPLVGAPVDLSLRLEALQDPRRFAQSRSYEIKRGTLERIKQEARRLSRLASNVAQLSTAEMAALAYPDRIGLRRKGDAPRFILSGGKGAVMPDGDPMAGNRLVVATDLDGNPREARIRRAVSISESELRDVFADQINWQNVCAWSKRHRRVLTRQQEQLGSLVLQDRIWKDAPAEEIATAMLQGVRDLGIVLNGTAARLVGRVMLARVRDATLPDMSPEGLVTSMETWLLPHLGSVCSAEDWKKFDLLPPLRAALSWDQMQRLDDVAPSQFVTPLGRRVPIDYGLEHPAISVRLQEMFGVTQHPHIVGIPLRVTLLSPAQRPVQVTTDLPGFWANSYADVRKDMRGRYPRHPWPEDPTVAAPTVRAKPRGT